MRDHLATLALMGFLALGVIGVTLYLALRDDSVPKRDIEGEFERLVDKTANPSPVEVGVIDAAPWPEPQFRDVALQCSPLPLMGQPANEDIGQ